MKNQQQVENLNAKVNEKIAKILKDSMEDLKAKGVDIEARLKAVADKLGTTPENLNVVQEIFSNETINSGVLVKVHVNMWRARVRLSPKELGIKEADSKDLKELEQKLLEYKGHIYMLDKEDVSDLLSIEKKARDLVVREGVKFEPYGYFISYDNLDTFNAKATEIQDIFYSKIDEVIKKYDQTKNRLLNVEHRKIAEVIFRRLNPQIQEHESLTTDSKFIKFADDFIEQYIKPNYKDKEYIKNYSKIEFNYFVIDSVIASKVNAAKQELLSKMENVTKESLKDLIRATATEENLSQIESKINKIDTMTDDDIQKKVDNLSKEEKEKLQKIQERKEKLLKMKEMVLNTQERQSEDNPDFAKELIVSIRKELLSEILDILKVNKNKDKYHQKTIDRILQKVEKIEKSNIFADEGLESILSGIRVLKHIPARDDSNTDALNNILVIAANIAIKDLLDLGTPKDKLFVPTNLYEMGIKFISTDKEEESYRKELKEYKDIYNINLSINKSNESNSTSKTKAILDGQVTLTDIVSSTTSTPTVESDKGFNNEEADKESAMNGKKEINKLSEKDNLNNEEISQEELDNLKQLANLCL